MMTSLRPEIRRAIALLTLLLMIFGAWALLVAPITSGFVDRGGEIAQARHLLGKYQSIAAKKSAAEQHLAQIQDLQSSSGEFLGEETPELASAALQTRLRTLVSANGVVMSAAQSLPGTEKETLQAVTLRVALTGDLDALKTIMYEIESEVPYLLIDNLEIRRSRTQNSSGSIDVDANLEIIGFLEKRQGSSQ